MKDNKMQKSEFPEVPELVDIPFNEESEERLLSNEVLEVFGVDFPNIDHFQTARSIIEIPKGIISKVIRKGNSMKLIGSTFLNGEGLALSFDKTLQMLPMGVDEIADCIVGIFLGKDVTVSCSEIESFIGHLAKLPQCVEPIWGLYIDETLESAQAQVITVATTKKSIT